MYLLLAFNLVFSAYLVWRIRQLTARVMELVKPPPKPRVIPYSTGISAFGAPPVGPMLGGEMVVARCSEIGVASARPPSRLSDGHFTPADADGLDELDAELAAMLGGPGIPSDMDGLEAEFLSEMGKAASNEVQRHFDAGHPVAGMVDGEIVLLTADKK